MKTLAEFNDAKGFNLKLTDDKVYVSAVGNEETFALRSVNGVGLYDNIEKYNEELEKFKKKYSKTKVKIFYGIAAVFFILGFLIPGDEGANVSVIGLIFGGYAFWMSKQLKKEPKMDSYFRLMLSGGSREFKFDKSGNNAAQVADFINKVEDTLTAYDKK